MNHIIIGIHGLANKPDRKTLKKYWQDAILNGLDINANIKCTEDKLNFHSVYWADVMYGKGKHDTKYDKYQDCTDKPQRYNDGWIDILRQKAYAIGGGILDFGKEYLDLKIIANKVLEKKLPDLYKYYTEDGKRDKLRGLLEKIIADNKDKKIVLVAHSMGSIIAYDVLRILGDTHPSLVIDHFITIGSPLGLPHVKRKIQQEHTTVRTPSIVKNWTNFADKRDPVALDEHLADDYQANSNNIEVKDDLVLNEWVPPNNGDTNIYHKSYGYLRTPEFSDIIKTFI